ncbi:hypothetical protein GCM10010994_26300 [Chelatococcus reniformis]|uniref:Leucine-binding protein domain-containing protein n=2 Tax=Chelatococcus reniformis TaxID=1494448 RepID=A0A916XER1_9HYPH|nr:hypothetical protein GCM10010994_26300 [Chelatococcus reniformis]
MLSLAVLAHIMPARAAEDGVTIGVMTDLSGIFRDYQGPGAVLGAQMAVEDFGGKVLGKPIRFISADYQKPDIASALARQWYDEDKVDLIVGAENSAVALAVMKIAKDRDRLLIVTGGAAMAITNEQCNDRTVNWGFDSWALAHGTASAVTRHGGKSWYFLTADYAFGHSMKDVAGKFVEKEGGNVVGSSPYPLGTLDFSSFLLKAQASGAQVIGLASAGLDTVNAIKQAAEFGIQPKQTLAGLAIFITDIHSLGLKATGGMYLTAGFYWDRDEATRAWSKRFFARHKAMPSVVQAGNYSAITHYLKAVEKVGSTDAGKVLAEMKANPIRDFFAVDGRIRDDGRMIHEMYLAQVKTEAESKYPWDYYRILTTIPRDEAFQPLADGACPLTKK